MPCPQPEDAEGLEKELDRYGLSITSLMVPYAAQGQDVVEPFVRCLDTVQALGVPVAFASVKAGDVPKDTVYDCLRRIGDAAAERGITVALETHPDLATNGDVALETIRGVGHPNIRINFDTANVTYYNHDVTAVGEVEKIGDYVAAVHLKDTNGGYQTWHFPTLGEGVVDFPRVFEILAAKGFRGPYTMELEGIRGEELTQEGVEKRVADSLAYLKSHGLVE
jgi:inosose dehydratase